MTVNGKCLQQVLSTCVTLAVTPFLNPPFLRSSVCIQSGVGKAREEEFGTAALGRVLRPAAVPRGPLRGGTASCNWWSTWGHLTLTTKLSQHETLLTSRTAGLCKAIKNQGDQGAQKVPPGLWSHQCMECSELRMFFTSTWDPRSERSVFPYSSPAPWFPKWRD